MKGLMYAIGGANYDKAESLLIDKDMLLETKKDHPSILYVPLANKDEPEQIEHFKAYFKDLGAIVDVLYLYTMDYDEVMLENVFLEHDIVYFSGGMTSRLVSYFKEKNRKNAIIEAASKGVIIAGVSAGAIMLFEYGYGDRYAYPYGLEGRNYSITEGLGILPGIFCPHYQNEGLLSFHDVMKSYSLNGYALANGSCLKIRDDTFCVLKNPLADAFWIESEKHKLIYLQKTKSYSLK